MGAGDLFDRPVYRILDQFLVPLLAFAAMIDLRDDIAILVIAVRIDGRDSANATSGGPCTRTCVIGGGDAFSTLDQRPYFPTVILNGF